MELGLGNLELGGIWHKANEGPFYGIGGLGEVVLITLILILSVLGLICHECFEAKCDNNNNKNNNNDLHTDLFRNRIQRSSIFGTHCIYNEPADLCHQSENPASNY